MKRSRGYLAFFLGVCLTAAICYVVIVTQRQQVQANFQRDADKVARDAEVRLQTYFDVLLGIKGMYALEDRIDRGQFHRFVAELKLDRRYPGFQAIQFVRVVPEAQLASFSAAVKGDTATDADGYPDFQVHPASHRDRLCERPEVRLGTDPGPSRCRGAGDLRRHVRHEARRNPGRAVGQLRMRVMPAI